MKKRRDADIFTRFTSAMSAALGRPWVFSTALAVLILWAVAAQEKKHGITQNDLIEAEDESDKKLEKDKRQIQRKTIRLKKIA